jgi:hypothetical protein
MKPLRPRLLQQKINEAIDTPIRTRNFLIEPA